MSLLWLILLIFPLISAGSPPVSSQNLPCLFVGTSSPGLLLGSPQLCSTPRACRRPAAGIPMVPSLGGVWAFKRGAEPQWRLRAKTNSADRSSGVTVEGQSGIEELVRVVQQGIRDETFVKASLGSNVGQNTELKNVFFRLVSLKRGVFVQCLFRYKTNDQTKNHPVEEVGDIIQGLIEEGFQQASVFTTRGDYSMTVSQGKHVVSLAPGKPTFEEVEVEAHDRKKQVPVEAGADFLQALGVCNKEGKPKPGMADKLRQIQKFVSIVDQLVDSAGLLEGGPSREEGRPLNIVDMGCGKGYLTFATHVHLSETMGVIIRTEGVELRRDLVDKTNAIASKLGLGPKCASGNVLPPGLVFREGYISDHSDRIQKDTMDVLIALHACDTATDDAIYCGIKAGAKVILTAPCCHKQVRRQIEATKGGQKTGVLQDVFRHGILREREAESATDAIRAMLLEMQGYSANVFEFIGGEHTAKNTMIAAVWRGEKDKGQVEALRRRLTEMLAFYGVKEQHLVALLGEGDATASQSGRNSDANKADKKGKGRGVGRSINLV